MHKNSWPESDSPRLRELQEFLARVSHELRNPVSGIVGFLHLLSKTDLDPVQREYVQAAQMGTQSLLALLNGLLDLSSAESGHITLDPQPIDLRECLENTARLFTPQARAQRLEMVTHIDPRIPDLVEADSLRLRQVLANLLSNALKFTDSGHVAISATLRSVTESEVVVRLAVEDSGRGIPGEKVAEIFQAFHQARREDRARGAGLGLAICKELIAAMGGILGVESLPGQGTIFWFDLNFPLLAPSTLTHQLESKRVLLQESHPQTHEALVFALTRMGARVNTQRDAPCDLVISDRPQIVRPGIPHLICRYDHNLPPDGEARSISRPLRLADLLACTDDPPTQSLQTRPIRQGRVLVIDDDALCRQLVVALASDLADGVDSACDGRAALALLEEHHYALVFIDWNLPDCNGGELAEKIRARGHQSVLVSLSGSLGACHPQFHCCLNKPVDPRTLEEVLLMPSAVDWEVLEKLKKYQTGAHQNLIRDLLDTFVRRTPERVTAIREHMQKSQDREVRRLAHQLAGSASAVGAILVAKAARSLEQAPEQVRLLEQLSLEVSRCLRLFADFSDSSLSREPL